VFNRCSTSLRKPFAHNTCKKVEVPQRHKPSFLSLRIAEARSNTGRFRREGRLKIRRLLKCFKFKNSLLKVLKVFNIAQI
jgi:hypothetical protein